MMDQNNSTIRTYMAIMAERDAAILERNMALDERKRALAERDMAMLQRDAVIAERNAALEERDKAISALQLRETSMNDDNIVTESSGGAEHIHYQHEMHQMITTPAYDPAEDPFNVIDPTPETDNPRRVKESKPKKASKLPRMVKREEEEVEESLNWQAVSTFDDWGDGNCPDEFMDPSDEEQTTEQDKNLEEDTGLEQVNSDMSAMPVPVCSCTGTPQPCYKWGNGGWQSACCTTTISMYPLPQASHKRYSRVGGRKMSGSAFNKLLSRLSAEGHDLSGPLDLKDHWAKHGTNRYSTVK